MKLGIHRVSSHLKASRIFSHFSRVTAWSWRIPLALLLVIFISGFLSPYILAGDGDGQIENLPPIPEPVKKHPKLDSSLAEKGEKAQSQKPLGPSKMLPQTVEPPVEKVRVVLEVEPGKNEAATNAVKASGGQVETSYGNWVQALMPTPSLTILADSPDIRRVRKPARPVFDIITSEGASVIGSNIWGNANIKGQGVKIAVLDAGFQGYTSLLGTELPSSVTTKSFRADQSIEANSKHGTGVAEIIYDIAPSAQLYLVNFGTDVEMGNAVDWLIAQGVNIISHSVGWPGSGTGDGAGPINTIVTKATNAGILWVNAAGNSGQQHWGGTWIDNDNDNVLNFTSEDEGQTFSASAGSTVEVILTWDDPWGSATNDYDLYLANSSTGAIVASSTYRQSMDGIPEEDISYTVSTTGTYYISVKRYAGTKFSKFNLFNIKHGIQYIVASGSITIPPADSTNAFSVGAVAWNTPGTLETYSSQGPTTDGRIKPDIVAPTGVSTVAYSPGAFYGTSSSAPHVSAAAALVKQSNPTWTPSQIKSFLESRAIELGTAGKDNQFGSGRLNLGALPDLWISLVTLNTPGNNNKPTFNWSTASGTAYYEVRVDGGTWGNVGNVVMYVWPTALADGTHTVEVRASDALGNKGAIVNGNFIIDTLPPSTPAILTKVSLDNNPFPVFKWNNATDVGSGIASYEVKVDSEAWNDIGNKLTFAPPTLLSQGSHTIQVRAKDIGGNTGIASSLSFNLSVVVDLANTKIAFRSSRDNDGEIYSMNTDGTKQTRLTNSLSPDLNPSWSPDGSKIAFQSYRDGNYEIYVMNVDGSNQTRITNNTTWDERPLWSPDGSKIIYQSSEMTVYSTYEIQVVGADGSNHAKLTDNSSFDALPVWSPDGSKLAFVSNRDGNYEIYVMNGDGSNQTRLTNNSSWDTNPVWSPDGAKIAFQSSPNFYAEIWVMNSDGSNQQKLTDSSNNSSTWNNMGSVWSPDGSKIAFYSNRSGTYDWEVYVMNVDGSNQTKLTSIVSEQKPPIWSPDGSKIAFVSDGIYLYIIYVMNSDGSQLTALTSSSSSNLGIAWSPFPLVQTPPTTPTNLSKTTPDNNNKPTFSWTASTDATSGVDYYEAQIDSGTWSNIGNVTTYTWPTALSNGSHTFEVKAVDKAGNTGSAASLTFNISTLAVSNLSVTATYFNSSTGSTTLSYTLSGPTIPVKLEVLNASSTVVRTIDAGPKAPGTYTIVWDGKNDSATALVEGSYILRLTAGSIQYAFWTKWGSQGAGNGQFYSPQGLAVDSAGVVYVTDTNNHRIQKFSASGTFLSQWGSSLSPIDIAIDGSGNVYVANLGNSEIHKYSADGIFQAKWGSPGSGDGQFNTPRSIAIDGSGNVYVADSLNNRVQKFTASGSFLAKWGSMGSGDGQFSFPYGIEVDSLGNVYVADTNNHRVQKFSASGSFLTKWGTQGSGDGQFQAPYRIAVDSSANVYVADVNNYRVQKFTTTGQFLAKWGSQGSGDGQFQANEGIAVDSSGIVYVADGGNSRIQKFAPPTAITAQASVTVDNTSPTTPTNLSKTSTDNNNKPTFSWTASTDATSGIDYYEVRLDTGSWTNIGNVTSYIWPSSVSDGNHTLNLRAVDKAANIGGITSLAFAIDATPPTTPTNLVRTTSDYNNKPAFTWSASTDATSGMDYYELRLDSGSWVNIGNVTSYTWPDVISYASHNLNLRAVDKAGNAGNSINISFNILLNQAPVAVISSPQNGESYFITDNISFNGSQSSDSDGDAITYEWSSSKDGILGTTATLIKHLTSGSHTISLKVSDGKGGPYTTSIAITVKTQKALDVTWSDHSTPTTIKPSQIVGVPITLTNTGTQTWPRGGVNPVYVTYHWYNASWQPVEWGIGLRSSFANDMAGGQTVSITASLKAPSTPGTYNLFWDVVQEGVAWFSGQGASLIAVSNVTVVASQAKDVQWVSHATPANIQPGQMVSVPITLTNTGSQTWPKGGVNPVAVSYHWLNQTADTVVVWDGLRSSLPNDVASGQTVTINAVLKAPPGAGPYILRWDVVQEGVTWFWFVPAPYQDANVSVAATQARDVQWVSHNTPSGIKPGETVNVSITLTNTGSQTWPKGGANPVAVSYHWLNQTADTAVVWDGLRSSLPNDVASGQTVTINAVLKAPSAAGSYILRWDVVQEGVTWFWFVPAPYQDASVSVAATQARDVQWVSHNTPSGIKPGETVNVSITLTNTGSQTWPKGGANPVAVSYHWLNQTADTVVVWDGLRSSLPNDLASGQTVTINAVLKAPSTAGTYNLIWDVVQDGVAWFSSQGAPLLYISNITVQ